VRADRWNQPAQSRQDDKDCSGIKCNIWERAKVRRYLTHELASGDGHNSGFDAFKWESVLRGSAGAYWTYGVLEVLPDKIGRFLFEYYSDLYQSLGLPALPEDRSGVDVHCLLQPREVCKLTYCCIYSYIAYTVFSAYFVFLCYFAYFA
jgi:hypothetical protein